MKKKLLIMSLMAASFSFAGLEGQLKLGYDFLRSVNNAKSPLTVEQKLNTGINLNLELIPVNVLNNRLEIGTGIGYTGGLFSLYPTANVEKNRVDYAYQVPIYGLAKVNLVNLESGDTPLYFSTRLGYSFLGSPKENKGYKNPDLNGGVYFGVGLGAEYKNFVAEVVYNGTFFKSTNATITKEGVPSALDEPKAEWKGLHRIGLEVGYRFGAPTTHKPEIVEVKHGILVLDSETGKELDLEVKEFKENETPAVIFLDENGYLVYGPNGGILGSDKSTDARYIDVINPDDTTAYERLRVFKFDPNKYQIKRDKNGNLVVTEKHGILVLDSETGKDTGLQLGEFSDENVPNILFLDSKDELVTSNGRLLGSNGDTNAKYVDIISPNDDVLAKNLKIFKFDPSKHVIKNKDGVKTIDKKHGVLLLDVKTHKDTGLQLGEYTENNLPNLVYVDQDGFLYTKDGNILGSKGTTNSKHVYIVNPDDSTVLKDGKPLILTVFDLNDPANKDLRIEKDKYGRKYLKSLENKEQVKPKEKPVLFPSHCSDKDNKCVINGFAVDGRLPNEGEVEQIKLFVDVLNDYAKSAKIRIVGHTDSSGSDSYNMKLGMTRATNIAKLLSEYGLKPEIEILGVSSKGKHEPTATNDTKDGRYLNRRVEILFDEKVVE